MDSTRLKKIGAPKEDGYLAIFHMAIGHVFSGKINYKWEIKTSKPLLITSEDVFSQGANMIFASHKAAESQSATNTFSDQGSSSPRFLRCIQLL